MAKIRKRKGVKGDVWIVDHRDAAGVRRWATCRTYREAEDVLAEKIRESRQTMPRPEDPEITLAEYAERWLTRVAPDLRLQTHQSYAQLLRLHILPSLGSLKVRAVHRARIKALLAEKRAAGLSKNTVRLIRATLSVVLSDAVDDGLLLANPALQLGRRDRKQADSITQAERQRKIRPMTPGQLEAFLMAAQEHEPRGCTPISSRWPDPGCALEKAWGSNGPISTKRAARSW